MEEKKNKRKKELQEAKQKQKEERAKQEAERKLWDDVVNELVQEKLYEKDEYDPGGPREPESRHQEPEAEPVYPGYDDRQRMGSPMVSLQVQDRRQPPSVEHVYQADPYINRPQPGGSHSRDTSLDRSRETSIDRRSLEQPQYPLGYGPNSNPLPDPLRDYEAYKLHLKPGHVPDGRNRNRKPANSYSTGPKPYPHPQPQMLQQQAGYQFTPPPQDRPRSHQRTDWSVSSDSLSWSRSPSPRRRWRSPSPRHRRRSLSPTRRRRSHSPAHRRSPSPARGRRSPSPARRRRSPSPARRRRSPSPARRRRSPSPARGRRSPSPARGRRSPSPDQRRRDLDIFDTRTQSSNVTRRRSPGERSRNSRDKYPGPQKTHSPAVQSKNVPVKGGKPANKTPAKVDTQVRGAKRAHSPAGQQNKNDPSKQKFIPRSLKNQPTRTPSSEKKNTQGGQKQKYDKSILERLQKNGKKLTCKICKTSYAFITGFESHLLATQHTKISQRLKGLLLGGQVRKEFGDMDVPDGYDKEIKLTSAFEKALAQATAAWKSSEGNSTSKAKQEDTNKVTSQHGSKKTKLELSATRQEQNSSVEKSNISQKSKAACNTHPKKVGKGQTVQVDPEFDAYMYRTSGDDVEKKGKDDKQKMPASAQKKETVVVKKDTVNDKKNEAGDAKDKGENGKQGKKNYYTIPVLTGQRDRTKGVTLKIIQTEEPKPLDTKDDPRQCFNIPVVEGKGGRGKGKRPEERQMTEIAKVPEESKLCELEDTPSLSNAQQELIRKQIRLVLAEELGGKTPELMEKIMATVSNQGGVNIPGSETKSAATENQKQKDEKDAKVSDAQQGQTEKNSSTGVVNKQKQESDSKSVPAENKDTSDGKSGDKISDKTITDSVKNEKNQTQQEKQGKGISGKDSSDNSGQRKQVGDDQAKLATAKADNAVKDDTNGSVGKADEKKRTEKSQTGKETKNSPVKPVNKPLLKDKADGDSKTAAGKANQNQQTEKKQAEENKSTAVEKPKVVTQQKTHISDQSFPKSAANLFGKNKDTPANTQVRNRVVPIPAVVSNQNATNRHPIQPIFQRSGIKPLFPNTSVQTRMRMVMRPTAPQVTQVQRFPQMMPAQSRPSFPQSGFQNRDGLPQRPPGPVTSQNMNTTQNVISSINVNVQNRDVGPRTVMGMSGPRPSGNSQPFPNNQMGMSGPRPSGNSQPFPNNQIGMSGPRPSGNSQPFPNNQMGISGPRPSGNSQPFPNNQMRMSGPRPSGNSNTFPNNQMRMPGPRPSGNAQPFPNNQMRLSGPRASGDSNTFPNNQMGMSGPRPSGNSQPFPNNQMGMSGPRPTGNSRPFANDQMGMSGQRPSLSPNPVANNQTASPGQNPNFLQRSAANPNVMQKTAGKFRKFPPATSQYKFIAKRIRRGGKFLLSNRNTDYKKALLERTSKMGLAADRRPNKQSNIDKKTFHSRFRGAGQKAGMFRQTRGNVGQNFNEQNFGHASERSNMEHEPPRVPDDRRFERETQENMGNRSFPEKPTHERENIRQDHRESAWRRDQDQALPDERKFQGEETGRPYGREERFPKGIGSDRRTESDAKAGEQSDVFRHKAHQARTENERFENQMEQERLFRRRELDQKRQNFGKRNREEGNWQDDVRPQDQADFHGHKRKRVEERFDDHERRRPDVEGYSHQESWKFEEGRRMGFHDEERHREQRQDRRQTGPGREREIHADRREFQDDTHYIDQQRHKRESSHREEWHRNREQVHENQGHDEFENRHESEKRQLYREQQRHPEERFDHRERRPEQPDRQYERERRHFEGEHFHDEREREKREMAFHDEIFHERDARQREEHFSHPRDERPHPDDRSHIRLRSGRKADRGIEQEHQQEFPEEQRPGSLERRRHQHSHEDRVHIDPVEGRHSEQRAHLREMERQRQAVEQEYHHEFPEEERRGSVERRRLQHGREGRAPNDNVEDRHSERAHRREMERRHQDFGQDHPEFHEQQRRGSVERRRHQRSHEDWAHTDNIEDSHSERVHRRDMERHHQDFGQDHHPEFPEQERRGSVERRRHQRSHEDGAHADNVEGMHFERAHRRDMERHRKDFGQDHPEFHEQQRRGSVERRRHQRTHEDRVHADIIEGRRHEHRAHQQDMERQHQDIGQEYHREFPEEQRPGSVERRGQQHGREDRGFMEGRLSEERAHRRQVERQRQEYHGEFHEEHRPDSLERRRHQHRHEGREHTDTDESRHEQRAHRQNMERRHQQENDHRRGRPVEDRNYEQQEHHRELERLHQETSQQDDARRRGRSSNYRREKEHREQRIEADETVHNFEQGATENDFVKHLREITGITDESVLVQAVRAVQSLEPDVIATLATMDPIIMQGIISGAASIESVLSQLPQSVVVALEEGNLHPEVLQRMMGGGFVDTNPQDGDPGSDMNMKEQRFRERNREGRRRGYRIRR